MGTAWNWHTRQLACPVDRAESRPELFGTSVVLQLRNKQNLETEDSGRSDHGGCGHQSENYFLTIYSLQEEVLMILTLFIKNSDSLLEPK